MKRILHALIRGYQIVGSPILRAIAGPMSGCRFQPSCSKYFLEAIEMHGSGRGVLLGLRRLLRCHPWGGLGEDPVPPARVFGARQSSSHQPPRSR